MAACPLVSHSSCVFHRIVSQSLGLQSTMYVASPGMDADTQGLASALALLGIHKLADLVELARTGSLVEMIF